MADKTIGDVMSPAWMGFLMWAVGDATLRSQFEEDTGEKFVAGPKHGLDALIDSATGVHETQAFRFAAWATVHCWGIDYAPQTFVHAIRDAGMLPSENSS